MRDLGVAEIDALSCVVCYLHAAERRFEILIRGGYHFGFSDGALLKSHIVLGTLRMLGILGIDGRRQLAVTSHYVHSFFDVYMKGSSVSPLKISDPRYPEIQVLE